MNVVPGPIEAVTNAPSRRCRGDGAGKTDALNSATVPERNSIPRFWKVGYPANTPPCLSKPGGDAFVDFVLVEVGNVGFGPTHRDMGVADVCDLEIHRRRGRVLSRVVDVAVEMVGVGVDFDGSP